MNQLSLWEKAPGEAVSWQGARGVALDRLDIFLPRAGRAYASNRNYDLGPLDRSNISSLSPWIRHRAILEEEVVRETLKRHSLLSAEKFTQEVFWRGYFKGWLEQRPGVWTQYCKDLEQLIDELDRTSDLRGRYDDAICGQTGIDCLDTWAQELVDTGYLHNHARMWFASIWIFTLRLPWQLGADFFLRHLLDGDPASNTLSWRWVAGLHTKGKTYLARKNNIEKFTNGRFSPEGLADRAEPLVERFEHRLRPLPECSSIGADRPFGLIITEEDCNPETLGLPGRPDAVCGLLATGARSPLPVGRPAKTFATEAVDDALKRAEASFGCPTSHLKGEDWGHALTSWAEQFGVKKLITSYAPVGPVRAALESARPALENAGISLAFVGRAYDDESWPHANKGFFKLRAKIPSIIRELDLM